MQIPNQDPVPVNRIDWLKIFPSLHLLQVVGFGFRARVFVPAMMAIILAWVGLHWIAQATSGTSALEQELSVSFTSDSSYPFWQVQSKPSDFRHRNKQGPFVAAVSQALPFPIDTLVRCEHRLLFGITEATDLQWSFPVLSLCWLLIVVSLFATSIARSTATHFCCQSRTGVFAGLRYSTQTVRPQLTSSLLMLLLIGTPLTLLTLFAYLFRQTALMELAWPAVYSGILLLLASAVIVTAAWAIATGAIGTDNCSGADALSRGINYVLSHKARTAYYCAWVAALSMLARLLANFAVSAANHMAEVYFYRDAGNSTVNSESASETFRSIPGLVQLFATVFPYAVHLGAFLAGITMVYVLLRQAEDAIRITEIDGGHSENSTQPR